MTRHTPQRHAAAVTPLLTGSRYASSKHAVSLHTSHADCTTQDGMVDRLMGRTLRVRVGGTLMRTRTAAASAVLILCTVMGSAACSSSSDGNPSSGTSTSDEQGKSQRQANRVAPDADPSACATSSEEIPEGCTVDMDVAEMDEATPATEPPATNAWVPPTN